MTKSNKNNNTTKKYEANNKISLRLSEQDNEYLHEKAQGHNISRSKFIRHLIHNNEHDLNHELSFNKSQMKTINNNLNSIESVLSKLYLNSYRIGGNLNQIAREMKNNVPNKLIKETRKNANGYKEDEIYITIIANEITKNCMYYEKYQKLYATYHKNIKKKRGAKK